MCTRLEPSKRRIRPSVDIGIITHIVSPQSKPIPNMRGEKSIVCSLVEISLSNVCLAWAR